MIPQLLINSAYLSPRHTSVQSLYPPLPRDLVSSGLRCASPARVHPHLLPPPHPGPRLHQTPPLTAPPSLSLLTALATLSLGLDTINTSTILVLSTGPHPSGFSPRPSQTEFHSPLSHILPIQRLLRSITSPNTPPLFPPPLRSTTQTLPDWPRRTRSANTSLHHNLSPHFQHLRPCLPTSNLL